MKITIENCSLIYIGSLQKAARKLIERDYPDSSEQEIHGLTLEELKKFSVNDQLFEYTSIKNRLGGFRWFFLCPKCGSRVSKLFFPPEGNGYRKKYLCKSCHDLRNQSAVMSQNKIYRKVTRPLKRLRDIEKKLDRGYLNSDKVQQLLNEYDKIEKELKSSTEYRLYAFKKRHGLQI